ncbi:DUF3667 domain-containing protein [Steroidobacter sp. S1-65]|uniref:DUF3667 domain-containing protein n=1 Tax=Steroidobacter gossypii TaxID=2805490 RepID=A0ABS1WTG5_9GAMM|nr:DUF3667 domain-containing protein [Steroidobacter gossypii]MBM0104274.1 DUF3667 domain-containing protein [Steroidobacter gossypii]
MEGHGEAAADVITGGVVARAVEPAAGEAQSKESHSGEGPGKESPNNEGRKKEGHAACLNCGAELAGAYCASCGQTAHPHRSLLSLGHDILHGVFHFEGKVWNTLPELFLRPGRLTRRYIDGERAKFVSPMALYLFSVFVMFAVFPFTSDTMTVPDDPLGIQEQYRENIVTNIDDLDDRIEALQEKLQEQPLSAAERTKTLEDLNGLLSAREVMDAMLSGDMSRMAEFPQRQVERAKAIAEGNELPIEPPAVESAPSGEAADDPASADNSAAATASPFGRIEDALKDAGDNPALVAYKLKTAGYKYSWALIPLSVPFMWLLFFWRRDIHAYDHAVFITYSISFMMLFVVLLSLAATLGISAAIWGTALAVIPPLHLYKQLRYAYRLSRFGTWLRLFLLSIMIFFVLIMFGILLLALGMTG